MKNFKIEIEDDSINIKTVQFETLFDADGNEVKRAIGNHRVALSIGDIAKDPANPTKEEWQKFQDKIQTLCKKTTGNALASIIADTKVDNDMVKAIKAERDFEKAERLKEKARADKAENDLNKERSRKVTRGRS